MCASDLQPESPTRKPVRRLAAAVTDLIMGLALVCLGIAGLVLPVLPGWLLIAAGAVVLAGRIPALRAATDWIVSRPWIQAAFQRIARHHDGRRPLVRLLKMPAIRRALFPGTRRKLVHDLTRSAAASGETDPGADHAR